MTAFGFKVAGDKMAAHQPTGMISCLNPYIKKSKSDSISSTSLGRVGAPTDMAGVALFLCSPASAHMTGGHLIVDGGSLMTTRRLSPDAAKLWEKEKGLLHIIIVVHIHTWFVSCLGISLYFSRRLEIYSSCLISAVFEEICNRNTYYFLEFKEHTYEKTASVLLQASQKGNEHVRFGPKWSIKSNVYLPLTPDATETGRGLV